MLPNILTALRIFLIPFLVYAFYTDSYISQWFAVSTFIVACLTDFLDGYFARQLSQTSRLGQFLDPIADKMLVATTLLLLVAFNRVDHLTLIPAAIIICREILVSGLREYLANFRVSLAVSPLAKWKTACQMTAITILLLGNIAPASIIFWGETLLWGAAVLSVITAWQYIARSQEHFHSPPL